MDGIHDLGGKQGFGAVETEAGASGFTERWHGAVFTMVNSLFFSGIAHNADYFRHSIERIDPVSYLSDGYYGRWLGGAETMLVEAGAITQQELSERAAAAGVPAGARIAARPSPAPDVFPPPSAADAEEEPVPNAQRQTNRPAGFFIGQRVRTTATPVTGHTRLPAYARAVVGEVIASHGPWVYPDSNAHGRGEQPCHLYTVAFDGDDLWGEAGEAGTQVCLDLFEPYLHSV